MPVKFSEEFNISEADIEKYGVFDSILDVDTRVFIDPSLLNSSGAPEFIKAKKKVENYFSNIITLLRHSKTRTDMYWKKADKLLTFKELSGTCFGYSATGTSGNSIGKELRYNVLCTMKELVDQGETDPVLFELLGVFQANIGCDRISDLITFILKDNIYEYTDSICKSLNIASIQKSFGGRVYNVCFNKYNNKELLLVPKVIVSPLPVFYQFSDIETICNENDRVRDVINKYFDFDHRKTKLKKEEIESVLKNNQQFRRALLNSYHDVKVKPYDFDKDPRGEYAWINASKEYTKRFPIDLSIDPHASSKDVYSVVIKICKMFKNLIENNQLNELLYDLEKKEPKHESAAQLLFYGIAYSYCEANNLDLTKEPNNGRGPVDFKVSYGMKDKVLVEVKLSSNPGLKHGISKQLPIYMKQEKTYKAIYLVIDTGHEKAMQNLQDYLNNLKKDEKDKIEVITIDGRLKKSASIA
jgi:hypothetical protein